MLHTWILTAEGNPCQYKLYTFAQDSNIPIIANPDTNSEICQAVSIPDTSDRVVQQIAASAEQIMVLTTTPTGYLPQLFVCKNKHVGLQSLQAKKYQNKLAEMPSFLSTIRQTEARLLHAYNHIQAVRNKKEIAKEAARLTL